MTGSTISSDSGYLALYSGNYDSPLTIESGVTVSAEPFAVVVHDPFTIFNYGTVIGVNTGVVGAGPMTWINKTGGYVGGNTPFNAYGTIVNEAGATIHGAFYAIQDQNGAISVTNYGVITADARAGVYGGADSEVDNKSGGTIAGDVGVSFISSGTVTNDGSIAGARGNGVDMAGTGTVGNTGAIYGSNAGVHFGKTGTGTIDNSGSIYGRSVGVYTATDGSSVTNESGGTITGHIQAGVRMAYGDNTLINHGSLHGSLWGAYVEGGSIDNSGTITAPGYGAYLGDAGGSLLNEAGGYIQGGSGAGVELTRSGTVENAGTIDGGGSGYAVILQRGGRVIVDHGAVFDGGVAARGSSDVLELKSGTGTVAVGSQFTGFETIQIDAGGGWNLAGKYQDFAGSPTSTGPAIEGFAAADTLDLTNLAFDAGDTAVFYNDSNVLSVRSGDIVIASIQLDDSADGHSFQLLDDGNGGTLVEEVKASHITGSVVNGIVLDGGAYNTLLTIDAGAYISNSGAGVDSVYSQTAWTLDNAGTILAVNGGGEQAINLRDGGSVTNEATGTINVTAGFGNGILAAGGPTTLVNHGLIRSGYSNAVYIQAGGTVTNDGTIAGVGRDGVILSQGGYLSNAAGGYIYGVSDGIKDDDNASLTLINAGTIISHSGAKALNLGDNKDVVNTGTILGSEYGVRVGADSTVENAGTITGTKAAVYMRSGDRLILDPGASFTGAVKGNGSTLELKAGASIGSLKAFGSEYTGFGAIAVDSGAAWDIAGKSAGFGGTEIDGFNSHDRLDINALAYDASDTASFDDTSNVLTIKDGGGSTLATFQLDDNADGHSFQLLDDGNGGTFAEESDYTPCFCRGTLIRTPEGDRPVEDLGIGDLVATSDGEALPLKWIGRRSYRDWAAVGNEDAQPILFKAGAIADAVPARDLYVSPEHAMFVDGMLVPAWHLVNGVSILKCEGVEEIDYFHLEFDRHVVIFAEDAPAESFVDDDSRMLFHNGDEYRRLYPDEPGRVEAEFCAPRVEDGPALAVLHRSLATRAAHLRAGGEAAPWGRRGKIDVMTGSLVSGWVFSGTDAGPQPLAILVNGAVVGRVVADRYRADLEAAGVGDGRHGFSFVLPKGLAAGDHRIEVRREIDWSLL
ncbi:MAG TPA: Hint domain-containing protein [Alphaproteobacteria bacterium]|nr:Hint domain-containing protein [Alphaproteobacteria bacterium]